MALAGVGVVFSTWWPPIVIVSRVRVARWPIRLRKLRVGLPLMVTYREALAWAEAERWAGRRGCGGRGPAGRGERRPGFAQVRGQVAGECADQHVGFDPVFEPVPDGPQAQAVFADAEVLLDAGEALVGLDGGGCMS